MKAEVIVFKCVVCGKSWNNVQSLRAHMKVHKGVEFGDLHVRLPVDRVKWFLEFCRRHNTTTCNMVLAILDAYEAGEKAGVVTIGGANPVIAQVNTIVASRPRGHGKYDLGLIPEPIPLDPLTEVLRCPKLDQRDWKEVGYPGRLGWCRLLKRWVNPELCLSCVHKKRESYESQ